MQGFKALLRLRSLDRVKKCKYWGLSMGEVDEWNRIRIADVTVLEIEGGRFVERSLKRRGQ
jgi:hypothetical protein